MSNPLRSWSGYCCSGGCHLPTIHRRTRAGRPAHKSIVKAAREQVPLTIATASTLYTLQGATTTPGLIYHFRTPRRISGEMKWIPTYMALSRVPSLKQLRSIGLTTTIRDIIDSGPPEGFLTRFLNVFEEKIEHTQKAVTEAMAELGWLDGAIADGA